jgi:hypothetical protein
MLPVPFALAGAVDVLFVVAESFRPDVFPLGGSHIAQLGILFGIAFALSELASVAKRARKKRQ